MLPRSVRADLPHEMPVVKRLQILLRDHAGPLLKGHGFRRSGGTFRHIAANGDVAVVSIRSWRLMEAELEFWVEIGLVTRVMLEYRAHLGEELRPELVGFTDTYGTWSTRMRDPAKTVLEGNDLWQFDLDDAGSVQRFLAALDSSVAELIALTERPALIEALRHPAPAVQTGSTWGLALLMADQGRSPELERLLGELRDAGQDTDEITWLEARADRLSAPPSSATVPPTNSSETESAKTT